MSNNKISPLVLYSLVLGVASQQSQQRRYCGDCGGGWAISIDSNMPALSSAMLSLLPIAQLHYITCAVHACNVIVCPKNPYLI